MIDEEQAWRSWEQAADAWDHFIESGLDYYRTELHGPALLDACGALDGLDVLDLGCGQGWFSRQLAGRGAHVTGIDWSAALIGHARRHQAGAPTIAYEVLDAARIAERFAAGSFDLVTACMSLMDMPRPRDVLTAAATLLGRDGHLVCSIPNPVTDAPYRRWRRDDDGHKVALEIDRYFETAPTVMDWNMKRLVHRFQTVQYRHTLEQWSRMIEDAGLRIARLREPRPSDEVLARQPALADAARVPHFVILDLTR